LKIAIIDIDSKIENIALLKCEKYHKDRGDVVVWNNELYASCVADKIYVSCIFTCNHEQAEFWDNYDNALVGGTGYDFMEDSKGNIIKIHDTKLPQKIEDIEIHNNWGFTTRGCNRNCPFCLVPRKEGKLKRVGGIYKFWDRKSKKITVMDNNLLADLEWFFHITDQIIKHNLKVDFNQGLDIRLLTNAVAERLKQIKTSRIRFAFDDMVLKPIVLDKIKILNKYKIWGLWYVMVGYDVNVPIESDIERVNILVKHNQRAFIQRHKNGSHDKRYIALSQWTMPLAGAGTIPFKEFINNTEKGRSYRKYFSKEYRTI